MSCSNFNLISDSGISFFRDYPFLVEVFLHFIKKNSSFGWACDTNRLRLLFPKDNRYYEPLMLSGFRVMNIKKGSGIALFMFFAPPSRFTQFDRVYGNDGMGGEGIEDIMQHSDCPSILIIDRHETSVIFDQLMEFTTASCHNLPAALDHRITCVIRRYQMSGVYTNMCYVVGSEVCCLAFKVPWTSNKFRYCDPVRDCLLYHFNCFFTTELISDYAKCMLYFRPRDRPIDHTAYGDDVEYYDDEDLTNRWLLREEERMQEEEDREFLEAFEYIEEVPDLIEVEVGVEYLKGNTGSVSDVD
jgi:hypothetical protein